MEHPVERTAPSTIPRCSIYKKREPLGRSWLRSANLLTNSDLITNHFQTSTWPIDRTLTVAINLSRPWRNGYEGVTVYFSVMEPHHRLVSYPGFLYRNVWVGRELNLLLQSADSMPRAQVCMLKVISLHMKQFQELNIAVSKFYIVTRLLWQKFTCKLIIPSNSLGSCILYETPYIYIYIYIYIDESNQKQKRSGAENINSAWFASVT